MAVDPATLKAILLALETAKDKQKRNAVLMAIFTPCLFLLLLIALILHILTSPLSFFAEWLLPDELKIFEDLQNNYGYTQSLGIYSEDWEDGYGQSYEGVIFTQGETRVTYYNQLDERWADKMYGTSSTIGEAGCGPTSMSIVISTLLGETHDPVELSKWSVDNGHRCEGNGSYHTLIPEAAKAYGLDCKGATKKQSQKIVDALADGKLVVAIMSAGHFTTGGHFIVLRGVTEDGKILVADPASYKRSEKEWDLSIIIDEARDGAAAGGPFWIISN
ncbi:MAG: C39 family peptidase [Eubacteriales bacterium]